MKSKVESSDEHIIKYNTAKFSQGLEWFTELFSINHNRELRVYELYMENRPANLLIPEPYELTPDYIKIEKLVEKENSKITFPDILPSIRDFIYLGKDQKRGIYDILSSPTQSVLRGVIRNASFLGIKIIFQIFKHITLLYLYKPQSRDMYLIHKDLKTNQNMIATEKGIYFIDFGSSFLTRHYFLTDVVELATDHLANKVNFDMLKALIHEIGYHKCNIQHLRSQIYLLLMRRTMHFGPADRSNIEIMENVKDFLKNLDSLVEEFHIEVNL